MNADEPTHLNVLVAGTGLHESILAAALSKSGYSVLQLDPSPYYGSEHASLSLSELFSFASSQPGASSSPSSFDDLPAELKKLSQRFSVSLWPMLLRAKGPALDLLVRSKVAAYLQFGLLGGVGLFSSAEGEEAAGEGAEGGGKGKGRVDRVPASKADVFNDSRLSLVEKRRLTKLLLFAAGQDAFEEDKVLVAEPEISFVDYLKKAFSLSGTAADSLTYALALCSSPSDPALPALQRLRSIIHAVGRYGPSPYLVGHYGGAGDLVGGFSRICAVWGGGQILGHTLGPLDLSPPAGKPVPPSQPPFMVHENPPPPPAAASGSSSHDSSEMPARPLGIPVTLEEGKEPTIFTGDWVVSAPHLLPTLFPSSTPPSSAATAATPEAVRLIAVLSSPVSFPPPREEQEGGDEPDSNLFVFKPGELREEVGTVTALQVGKGTMGCPEGYHILYLSAPHLTPTTVSPSDLLQPYLDALLSLPFSSPSSSSSTPCTPLLTLTHSSFPPSPQLPSLSLPANFLLTPSPPLRHKETASLVDTLDDLVFAVEESFWRIVGEEGRREGVEFFKREVGEGEGEE
ncbi:hypothetical protein JCM8547_002480 [Rhodosporidiobolus lusitaniae]